MPSKICDFCSESSYMLFPCRLCGKSFCAVHRLPENHGCIGGMDSGPSMQAYELSRDQQGYYGTSSTDRPGEYVWEPTITELPDNPFDPSSGVVIKGIFWPRGNEVFHIVIAFILMFIIGMFISGSVFSGISGIPTFDSLEQVLFPYYLATLSTSGFLIHEFSHRQVGRRFKLPAKFRLLTFGMIITVVGILGYLIAGFPPFALPGAVVVIGLENKDQAGKCKIAGPLSNFIISMVLLPLMFTGALVGFEYSLLFLLGAYINTFLGVFNMLPIGMLDGRNIISWKKGAWLGLMSGLLALLVIEFYFMNNPMVLLNLVMG